MTPFNQKGRELITKIVDESALRMDNPADLINVAIEELIKNCYELPGFNTLDRLVSHLKNEVNQKLFSQIVSQLNAEYINKLQDLLETHSSVERSPYNDLKKLPHRSTRNHLNDLIAHLIWLETIGEIAPLLKGLTQSKIKHFTSEAKALTASEMKDINLPKRLTLILCLIYSAQVQTRDNLVEMFLKQMKKISIRATEELQSIKEKQQATTEKLVSILTDILQIFNVEADNSNSLEQLQEIFTQTETDSLKKLEALIAERMPERNLIDILKDVDYWTNFTRHFGPLSGSDPKLERAVERYLLTTFTYGCNLGATQAARHMRGIVTPRMLTFVNQRHISLKSLNAALVDIINRYNVMPLTKSWGDGTTAAADGTKYDLYEQNLISEYHIRYGGYGGIAYHHVADTYIALFSARRVPRPAHFIPCGTWEAVYIIEGLLKNQSDVQPQIIHADTQGQSTPVFALSYLLGIELMPRIRNWQDLVFYRPEPGIVYHHIDSLFKGVINWELIKTHWSDLMRVVLSIESGRISSDILLRKLGNYSRKVRIQV